MKFFNSQKLGISCLRSESMKIYINTLGEFDLLFDNESKFNEINRAYRLIRLFQYFLTFRNKKLLPETILDNLWRDCESYDPKNMLRAQIFRLRNLIKKSIPEDGDESDYLRLSFTNGYYCLETGSKVVIDVEEFEKLISIGDLHRQTDINNSIKAYKDALKLYSGEYLNGNAYEMWLVPIRGYYHRLFIKTTLNLLDILNGLERYEEIVETCEKALHIDPYNEAIHISLMESMLKLGQIKNALSHYEQTVNMLEKEMEQKPSFAMREMYRKIQSNFIDKSISNIFSIKERMEEKSKEGALLCDIDYFKFLFNHQNRNKDREELPRYLGLISITPKQNHDISKEEIKIWHKTITELLGNELRKGDTFTFWNDTQVLLMLFNVKDNGINGIKNRISNKIEQLNIKTKYDIQLEFVSLKEAFN